MLIRTSDIICPHLRVDCCSVVAPPLASVQYGPLLLPLAPCPFAPRPAMSCSNPVPSSTSVCRQAGTHICTGRNNAGAGSAVNITYYFVGALHNTTPAAAARRKRFCRHRCCCPTVMTVPLTEVLPPVSRAVAFYEGLPLGVVQVAGVHLLLIFLLLLLPLPCSPRCPLLAFTITRYSPPPSMRLVFALANRHRDLFFPNGACPPARGRGDECLCLWASGGGLEVQDASVQVPVGSGKPANISRRTKCCRGRLDRVSVCATEWKVERTGCCLHPCYLCAFS